MNENLHLSKNCAHSNVFRSNWIENCVYCNNRKRVYTFAVEDDKIFCEYVCQLKVNWLVFAHGIDDQGDR